MSWNKYVQACQTLGFSKVTLINRDNHQILAYSSAKDVPKSWKEEDSNSTINELKQLSQLDSHWNKLDAFFFYGQKYLVLMKDNNIDKKWLICYKAREVCCVYQFDKIWFVVSGTVQPRNAPKNSPGFKIVAEAVNRIFKEIWDPLIDIEDTDSDTDDDSSGDDDDQEYDNQNAMAPASEDEYEDDDDNDDKKHPH